MKFYTNVFARGNNIFVRGYDGDRRFFDKISYSPYLFVPARNISKTEFKTLDGRPVDKMMFDSMSDARDFIKRYQDVANVEIFGLTNFQYLFIYDEYHGEIKYDMNKINIISLDIETDSSGSFPDINTANKEITAITLSRRGEKVVFGLFPYKPKSDKVTYIHCKDEYDLLEKFIHVWQSGRFTPDIVTGWNIEFFDLPYLVNRITNLLGRKEACKLSPFGMLEEKTIEIHGNDNQTFVPAGINVLDYFNLYKKFKFAQQENYKLETIAKVEKLPIMKLDYKEQGYKNLDDLYKRNFELFIDYNIQDTTVVDLLEEKLKFIELVVTFAYDAKVNYNDTLTTVRPWDVIIHNYLLDRAIVVPQNTKKEFPGELMGGYVKDPKIGMSKWVVSFDVNSMYPMNIIQYNISPETYLGRVEHRDWPLQQNLLTRPEINLRPDASYAANGTYYRKDKMGFLPVLMQKMYDDRVVYKNKMTEAKKAQQKEVVHSIEYNRLTNEISKYHNLQLATKIKINSVFGAVANTWFRWFDFDLAEAITASGQLAIQWVGRDVNNYMNKVMKTSDIDYITYMDTDSMYINMEPLVDLLGMVDKDTITDSVDKFCEEKIQKIIDKSFSELAVYLNVYQNKMVMKRETIAERGIWRGKKMYILNALDIEGVRFKEPELKMQGIEAVRSSTPAACRASIKDALKIIMNSDEETIQKYITEFKLKFMNMKFEEIAFPRGVKGLDKYADRDTIYTKGTPIHTKGALIYNHHIKKLGLEDSYQMIGNGDKIKFSYLKMPNTFKDTVISVPDELPEEFDIQKYIDYETQFQKSFLEPIKSILDVIGWQTEKRSSLEDFFN